MNQVGIWGESAPGTENVKFKGLWGGSLGVFKEQQEVCMSSLYVIGSNAERNGKGAQRCKKTGGKGPDLVGPCRPIRTLALFSK